MKKANIMPVAVLTAICLVVAALLGGINLLTKDKIAENKLKKEQASLIEVLPGASVFDKIEELPENLPSTVKDVYRERGGLGYVIIVVAEKTDYSSGDMTISVGISDGKITGAKITSYFESKDLGKGTYPQKFVGLGADDYDSVDIVSGVTYSSKAFKAAIGDALAAESTLTSATAMTRRAARGIAATEGEELSAKISALIPGKTFTKTALPIGADATLADLYTVDGGGYVLHIIVAGQYVPVATEAVVYIDASYKVAAIDLMQWVVGHGVGAGGFEDGFVGKDVYSSCEVEIVSGATGTSYDFKKGSCKGNRPYHKYVKC